MVALEKINSLWGKMHTSQQALGSVASKIRVVNAEIYNQEEKTKRSTRLDLAKDMQQKVIHALESDDVFQAVDLVSSFVERHLTNDTPEYYSFNSLPIPQSITARALKIYEDDESMLLIKQVRETVASILRKKLKQPSLDNLMKKAIVLNIAKLGKRDEGYAHLLDWKLEELTSFMEKNIVKVRQYQLLEEKLSASGSSSLDSTHTTQTESKDEIGTTEEEEEEGESLLDGLDVGKQFEKPKPKPKPEITTSSPQFLYNIEYHNLFENILKKLVATYSDVASVIKEGFDWTVDEFHLQNRIMAECDCATVEILELFFRHTKIEDVAKAAFTAPLPSASASFSSSSGSPSPPTDGASFAITVKSTVTLPSSSSSASSSASSSSSSILQSTTSSSAQSRTTTRKLYLNEFDRLLTKIASLSSAVTKIPEFIRVKHLMYLCRLKRKGLAFPLRSNPSLQTTQKNQSQLPSAAKALTPPETEDVSASSSSSSSSSPSETSSSQQPSTSSLSNNPSEITAASSSSSADKAIPSTIQSPSPDKDTPDEQNSPSPVSSQSEVIPPFFAYLSKCRSVKLTQEILSFYSPLEVRYLLFACHVAVIVDSGWATQRGSSSSSSSDQRRITRSSSPPRMVSASPRVSPHSSLSPSTLPSDSIRASGQPNVTQPPTSSAVDDIVGIIQHCATRALSTESVNASVELIVASGDVILGSLLPWMMHRFYVARTAAEKEQREKAKLEKAHHQQSLSGSSLSAFFSFGSQSPSAMASAVSPSILSSSVNAMPSSSSASSSTSLLSSSPVPSIPFVAPAQKVGNTVRGFFTESVKSLWRGVMKGSGGDVFVPGEENSLQRAPSPSAVVNGSASSSPSFSSPSGSPAPPMPANLLDGELNNTTSSSSSFASASGSPSASPSTSSASSLSSLQPSPAPSPSPSPAQQADISALMLPSGSFPFPSLLSSSSSSSSSSTLYSSAQRSSSLFPLFSGAGITSSTSSLSSSLSSTQSSTQPTSSITLTSPKNDMIALKNLLKKNPAPFIPPSSSSAASNPSSSYASSSSSSSSSSSYSSQSSPLSAPATLAGVLSVELCQGMNNIEAALIGLQKVQAEVVPWGMELVQPEENTPPEMRVTAVDANRKEEGERKKEGEEEEGGRRKDDIELNNYLVMKEKERQNSEEKMKMAAEKWKEAERELKEWRQRCITLVIPMFSNAVSPSFSLLASLSYELSESAFLSMGASASPFAASLTGAVKDSLRLLQPLLLSSLFAELVNSLLSTHILPLILSTLASRRFSLHGAFLLDRDVRSLSSFFSSLSAVPVKSLFAPLAQMVHFLRSESISEAKDYYDLSLARRNLLFSSDDVKRILLLRSDFNPNTVAHLALG
ncbi:Conserved oligomeric Golgi complex subunit 4 (COG4) [Monocercomonoides exilis]|uniref:Conserved oligomeric Golgi complex subunit 4 (COG4) n=1 Tax=Monocercomonoides exilis TaxID=2049356 RepID=UPI003559F3ED|nr:Conserved oligomeric Golgi complex subunit 4 (COG4) [Monocercomonoides exilis]|eukprot:MONOS_2388.1-p1 / transcript=MONOS_2388.1 / gene=MONOS_2388 / organism=Monocercomonoides_exilis_PA203 / gene_product= Conserved oligomeric Golgi complex subunit 4 (COG4), putative / transcript_product= Conserved oligomeric Golgi complex subunit 4 (COG4), putative / location=Mono_scaffold00049:48020-52689(-) / protein_length=1365 / sequence_SO=supercontig / SO=protein_coding / is_pseudo=false